MTRTVEPTRTVDSYRFLDVVTRQVVKSWISLGRPGNIPWTPLAKPLSGCTVALVSSAAIALRSDRPFDQELERQDPWFSDPSYRVIPRSAATADIKCYHLHINPAFAEQDLNCILPLQQLSELEANHEIRRVAPSHYSYSGYTTRPQPLLQESVPAIVRQLQQEDADIVALVPV